MYDLLQATKHALSIIVYNICSLFTGLIVLGIAYIRALIRPNIQYMRKTMAGLRTMNDSDL